MKNKLVFFIITLVVLSLILGLAYLFFFPTTGSGKVFFRVEQGESLIKTAQKLEKEKLITSAMAFRVVYTMQEKQSTFPAGIFQLPRGLSTWNLAHYFSNNHPESFKITIPEGWTKKKIASSLEKAGIVDSQAFLQALEDPQLIARWKLPVSSLDGFLFPDTYFWSGLETPREIVTKMVDNFFSKTKGFIDTQSPELYDTLILASIVEREYRVKEEAPIMASVFLNRLKKKIPLASCATIEYIITEVEGKSHPKRILFSYTKIPSPYNTYMQRGLPPGPICNPGLDALQAAFHPASTNYLYFVLDDQAIGKHNFSVTWDEHEKAKEEYIKNYVVKD